MRVFIWIVRLLCLLVAVWSVYGFGGPTLVKLLEINFGFSLIGGAAIVSVLVAVFGVVSLFPVKKPPAKNGAKQL